MSEKLLKPDAVLKDYWRRNAEFADLFNAFLYGGREVIKAESLVERDTDSSAILETDDGGETKQGARDLFKVVMSSDNTEYVLLGIENQDEVHYAMPLRNLEYSTVAYVKQFNQIKEKYPKRKGLKPGAEFLSGMKKTDKLTPVITLCLYYGDKEWDAAKSLYEMMDVPTELQPFVGDFKLNLVEVRNSSLKFNHKNNKDLFTLFNIIYDKERNFLLRKNEIVAYTEEHRTEKLVLRAVTSVSGVRLSETESEEKEMRGLFKEIYDDAEKRGIVKGIIELSQDYHLSEEAVIQQIEKRLNVTASEATKYYREYKKSDNQIKELNVF